MAEKIFLTGIKPTGEPHLGNYLGAIKPALELAQNNPDSKKYFFIADYHALTTIKDKATMSAYRANVAATWLAFFKKTKNCYFYFQSQIPEIFELYWILSCFCPKGLLNRAHAYKGLVAKNIEANHDPDRHINQGLFSYPVLMAADILLFKATHIPVGADQKQHVEIATEIVKHINHHLNEKIPLPIPVIDDKNQIVIGIDGQKMSKNYNNTLPIFSDEKALKKRIGKIKTDSTPMGEPLDWQACNVFKLYSLMSSSEEQARLKTQYESGAIGFGHAKMELLTGFRNYFGTYKTLFDEYEGDTQLLSDALRASTESVQTEATKNLDSIKQSLGLI